MAQRWHSANPSFSFKHIYQSPTHSFTVFTCSHTKYPHVTCNFQPTWLAMLVVSTLHMSSIFLFRMFVNSLLLSLFTLSLVRLEISLSPFRFQSHDHKRISTIALLLILGLPMAETAIRLVVQGHDCDCDTFVLVRGLYEGNELVPSFSTFTCSQVNLSGSFLDVCLTLYRR